MRNLFNIALCCVFLVFPSQAAPKAELWERWTKYDNTSTDTVSHSQWDTFLKTYIANHDGINLLNYSDVTPADKKALDDYLTTLSQTPISSLNRDEQRAFWINLYNALTIQIVLQHYPVSSIRDIDISSGFFSSGPWGEKIFEVEGEELSLNDIEHRILRPIWQDARLHYSVNCASAGCPNLAAAAYTAANSEELLDMGAVDYVNHSRGAEVKDGRLVVSSIYKWFIDDFGGNDEGVIAHLKKYAKPDLAAALEGITSIDDDDYDWSINESK